MNRTTMENTLGKHCAMAILAALALASLAALVAWEPVVPAGLHHHADERRLWGIPNALNVLVGLPCLGFAAWGWRRVRAASLPADLRDTWVAFQVLAVATSLVASAYHLWPATRLLVASHAVMAAAFTMLTFAFLAERVDSAFASRAGRATAIALSLAMTAIVLLRSIDGDGTDLRPLLWLELLPVLLVPAGALGLQGRYTSRSDWMVALGLYGVARLLDMADARVLEVAGISGHTLMHLGLGAVAAWTAYCTTRPAPAGAASDAPASSSTALKTAAW